MIIWGGAVSGTMFDINVNDGARYDPSTDRWTAMSTVAAPAPRVGHAAAWIEKTHEMMIWGGIEGSDAGGLYNTDTNSWRSLPLDGAPTSRWVPALVATGDEAIVWCGRAGDQPVSGDGAVYDPAANRWRPVATEGAPPCNLEAPYAWTGREFIVWGGNGTVRTNGELFAGHPSVLGGLYDPVLDRWRPLAGTPPPGRWAASGVFGDGSFIVTGGVTSLMGDVIADGAIYDIAAGTWRVLPSSVDLGPIFPRGGGVWLAGGTLGCSGAAAFWGGSLLAGGGTDDGVLYLPGTDQWEHMAFAGAPTSRYRHTEVSTGTTVIVWGGSSMGVLTDTGGVYTP
jgi:hypothetical protein